MIDGSKEVHSLLVEAGGIHRNGHFIYTSGRHGPDYVNIDPVLPNTALVHNLSVQMVTPFWGKFDTILGPAVGGIPFITAAAQILYRRRIEVAAVWADKQKDELVIDRSGFAAHIAGKRILILDDILTSGSSIINLVREVQRLEGKLIGATVICNRGNLDAPKLGVPKLEQLFRFEAVSYAESACLLCKNQVPIVTNVGHGSEYRQRKPRYRGKYTTI